MCRQVVCAISKSFWLGMKNQTNINSFIFFSDALWNYLNRPGHNLQLTAGYRAPQQTNYDSVYVVDDL